MVLSTRVFVINDSSERIKIKADTDRDRQYDRITNIEPGERYEVSGSISGSQPDVEIDIITNPVGPDNNVWHGGFRFDNPAFGSPNVESYDFTYAYAVQARRALSIKTHNVYTRDTKRLVTKWGKIDESETRSINDLFASIIPQSDPLHEIRASMGDPVEYLYRVTPRPLFTIEAFTHDQGAKTWDLRFNSDNSIN